MRPPGSEFRGRTLGDQRSPMEPAHFFRIVSDERLSEHDEVVTVDSVETHVEIST